MSDRKFGLVCATCVSFKSPELDFMHYAVTDILTKKSVQLTSEEYSDYHPADILDAMFNTTYDNNVPGIVFIMGWHTENNDAIIFELMPMPPCIRALEGSMFACCIDTSDDKRVYRDINTGKILEFENIDANVDLRNGLNTFLSDEEYNSYNELSEDRIIIIAKAVDYRNDKIYINANDVQIFGDKSDVYDDMINDFKTWFEKQADA